MALIIKKEIETGIKLTGAYIKIAEIMETKKVEEKYNAVMLCEIYASKEAREENKIPIEKFRISFSVDIENNLFIQGYEYLKNNVYLDAVDC